MRGIWLEYRKLIKIKWIWIVGSIMLICGLLSANFVMEQSYLDKNFGIDEFHEFAKEYDGHPLLCVVDNLKNKESAEFEVEHILTMYSVGHFSADEAKEALKEYKDIDIYNYDFLKHTQIRRILSNFLREVSELSGYNSLLNELKTSNSGLSGIGLLKNDEYVKRVAQKNEEVYANTDVILKNYHLHTASKEFLDSRMIDVFVVGFLFYIVLVLFNEEHDNGYTLLTKTTASGRKRLFINKIFLLGIVSFITVMIFSCAWLLWLFIRFGVSDLLQPVQSIAGYGSCPYNISIASAIALSVALKGILFYWLIVLLACIASVARKSSQMLAVFTVLFVVVLLIFQAISYQSFAVLLKIMNPIYITDSVALICSNRYVNIGGYPISSVFIVVITIVLLLIVVVPLGLMTYENNISERKLHIKTFYFTRKVKYIKSMLLCEMNKIFKAYRIWVPVSLVLIFAVLFFKNTTEIPISQEELFYQEYMDELKGKITFEKQEFIRNEQFKYERLNELYLEALMDPEKSYILPFIEQLRIKESAFNRVLALYDYVSNNSVVDTVVYETGYEYILGIRKDDIGMYTVLSVMLLLVLLLPYCSYVEYHRNACYLTRTVARTRKEQFIVRFFVQYLIAILITCIISVGDIFRILRQFGSTSIDDGIKAMLSTSTSRWNVPIIIYIILIIAIRLIGAGVITLISMYVVSVRKDYFTSVLLMALIVILPNILYLQGIRIFAYYPANLLLEATGVLKTIFVQ